MKSNPFKSLSIVLLYFSFIGMCLTIYQYTTFDKTIGFLSFKQTIVSNSFWRTAFYIHVFTCFFCLGAGFTQFSNQIRKKYPKIHRFIGKLYFYNIAFINFPVAIILGIYANGNIPGKIAFILLDLLWAYFTFAGVYWIRKGNIEKHQRFMIRSYALTLTAITLRISKMIMAKYSDWSYDDIYIFDAWFALSFNLLVGELIIYRKTYLSNRKLIEIK